MKIHSIKDCPQGSDIWLRARAGKITATEAESLLTPLFKKKESKAVDTYLGRKLAERWLGSPLPDEELYALPAEWGLILEQEAKPMFTLLTGIPVANVGLIETDDGVCSCSPDAVADDENFAGLEIKAPLIQTHCKYLIAGVLPPDYAVQVHFSMFVTGFERWYFMSYRRMMPPLILKIERDEEIQKSIADAVASFKFKMDEGWSKIIALNGGQQPVRNKKVAEVLAEDSQPETHDLPH